MIDFIVILIIVAIVAGAIWKIYSEKKKGAKCIGCAYGKSCQIKSCDPKMKED